MSNRREIVSAVIHPGIGIARVGNSEEFFIGPEVPHAVTRPPEHYRDKAGRLKRQAARFRVYGLDAAGHVVSELTAGNAEITWTVEVANKKASWYDFVTAMDIPEAVPTARRNSNVHGEARRGLDITPGPAEISGRAQQVGPLTGTFLGTPVDLGALHTDDEGRLIFAGGRGVSASPLPDNRPYTFANNDGWYDDVSDGPVSAAVLLPDGRRLDAKPAWVVVAPPNYAPDLFGIVTMYDVLINTYVGNWLAQPKRPSFRRDILPVLERFAATQWVNQGFLVQFGWEAPDDFQRLLPQLASAGPESAELRRQVFNQFRYPSQRFNGAVNITVPDNRSLSGGASVEAWPWFYGDAVTLANPTANAYLPVTELMYQLLGQWAAGDFDTDALLEGLEGSEAAEATATGKAGKAGKTAKAGNSGKFGEAAGAGGAAERIEDVRLADQPATLDRAALEFCLGGPFHPGCELTWPMRISTMYSEPFRIRRRPAGVAEPDYGDVLQPSQVVAQGQPTPGGPLYFNGPGDLTRFMAVPWQTDTSSCRSGYVPQFDPYLPTFWPARVPNQVLTAGDYAIVMDKKAHLADRLAAFRRRATWYRFLGPDYDYLGQIDTMIGHFGDLGLIAKLPGPGLAQLPPEMFVETGVQFPDAEKVPADRGKIMLWREKLTVGARRLRADGD